MSTPASAAFYIADLRPSFNGAYITFWRPENAGYAYPLSWAGRYTAEQVAEAGPYYAQMHGRAIIRFAVPCDKVDAIAVDPLPGTIDGDAGPVIRNTPEMRAKLRRWAVNRETAKKDQVTRKAWLAREMTAKKARQTARKAEAANA